MESFVSFAYHAIRLQLWRHRLGLIHVRGKSFQELLMQGANRIDTAEEHSHFSVQKTNGFIFEKGMRQKTFAAVFHAIE